MFGKDSGSDLPTKGLLLLEKCISMPNSTSVYLPPVAENGGLQTVVANSCVHQFLNVNLSLMLYLARTNEPINYIQEACFS